MEFTVIDYQATPSGYYQISFRSLGGETLVCTQYGRGGCNFYTPIYLMEEFKTWLESWDELAIEAMRAMGYPELAQTVVDHDAEWYDIVVMAIADAIESGTMKVEG